MLHLYYKLCLCSEAFSHFIFCRVLSVLPQYYRTDIGRTLLVGVMSVLSVMLLLPDCTGIGRTLLVGVMSVLSVMLLLPDCTDIGRTLLVGVMSVLSVMLILPDCIDIGRTLLVGVMSVLSVMLLLPDCTDIGRTLLVGVMSVLSVMLLLPNFLCCTGAIFLKSRHVATEPLRLLPQTIDLIWGILYPFHEESAVGLISVAPVQDFSATGGRSWDK